VEEEAGGPQHRDEDWEIFSTVDSKPREIRCRVRRRIENKRPVSPKPSRMTTYF